MWADSVSIEFAALLLSSTAIFAFVVTKFDILHPFTIVASVMALTAVLSCVAPVEWNLSISWLTVFIVELSVLCFGVGSLFSDRCIRPGTTGGGATLRKQELPDYMMIIMCFVLAFFAWLNFREVYDASIRLGNHNGYLGMLGTLRHAVEAGDYSFPRMYVYRNYLAQALTFFAMAVFFQKAFQERTYSLSRLCMYGIPLLFYLPFTIISGERITLFCMIVFLIVAGGVIYQRAKGFTYAARARCFGFAVGGGGLFLMLFVLFGFFTGKVSLQGRPPWEVIAHYGGLSLPALSFFLESTFLESAYVGKMTLLGIYQKLALLGMDFSDLPSRYFIMDFVQLNHIDTNVYTGLRRYIQDYGFVGMCLVMMFLGMVYTAFYNYIRFRSRTLVPIIIYASIAWPLFWLINEEGFFTSVLQTNTIYIIVLICLLGRICNWLSYGDKQGDA